MFDRLRSLLRDAWPFVGAAYLAYLAFRPPPIRYVGVGGLVVVTPLLVGWTVGHLFGVGPWAGGAASGSDASGEPPADGDPTGDDASEDDGSNDPEFD